MIPYSEFSRMSATSMAARIAAGQISPVEMVDSAIAIIEERNPSLNAMVIFGFQEARERARVAEAAVQSGVSLPPLHGVPVAMKDCFDYKPGWRGTFGGVPALKDFTAETSCAFAHRMEQAGAIIVGRTNSPMLGFRGTCDNVLFGPTRNPFDLSRNSGGSSGGSGALVGDGLLPIAEGTDGGGSIRIPASWCGAYGYFPSFGRVPNVTRPNGFVTGTPYASEGPITRTVADAALAMQALGGYDSRDPHSLTESVDYLGSLQRDITGMKIAYSPDYGIFPIQPPVTEVVEEAVHTFQDLGAHVDAVQIAISDSHTQLSEIWCLWGAHNLLQAIDSFKTLGFDLLGEARDDLPPQLHYWLDRARHQTAHDWLRSQQARTRVYDAIEAVMADYDLLVTPTLACVAVENTDDGNTLGPDVINGEAVDPLIGWCCTYIQNFTGHPAATLPAGLSPGNLPVGLQIAGRRFADADVLAASHAFEQARPWRHTYEICEQRNL